MNQPEQEPTVIGDFSQLPPSEIVAINTLAIVQVVQTVQDEEESFSISHSVQPGVGENEHSFLLIKNEDGDEYRAVFEATGIRVTIELIDYDDEETTEPDEEPPTLEADEQPPANNQVHCLTSASDSGKPALSGVGD